MTSSLSDLLARKKASILNIWEIKVTEALPAARLESKTALRDSIPEFIDDLVEALKTSLQDQRKEIVRFAHKHGAERANLSEYSIEDALFEYNLLRKIIFSELEREAPISAIERDIILEGIHLGMAKAGAEYAKMQMRFLQNEKDRLRKIADIQPSLIGHTDINFRYLFVNQTYEDWFGIRKEDFIGKTVEEVVGPEAYKLLEPHLMEVKKGKKAVFEKHIHYQNGIQRFTHSTYSPDFDSEGNVKGIFISVSDHSEQRRILEAFMRSEEVFRNLANALPQISWVSDPHGNILWFNDRFYQYSGMRHDEALGQGWLKIHGDTFKTTGKEKFLEHLKDGSVWEDTFPLHGQDGKWRWFLSRAIPIKNTDGTIGRWLGTCTDITEQKLIADSLHKEQMLRDKFISALSHDLRTPLTAATLSSQLIPRKSKDITITNLANKISTNLKRVDKMIEDLLDANRLRAGQKIKPNLEEMDISELTRNTIIDLETIYGDRFVVDVPEKLIVWLSVHGTRRIIENLCSNAIKYGSSSAPVSVYIHIDHEFLELGVHNFGNPLIGEDNSKLFEEYVRARAEEQSEKRGWGIGLSIVKGVVEVQGGEVDIDSDEHGTLFKVRLPIDARKFLNSSDTIVH